jgi:sec-independent protein translocase protein TatB
MFDFAWTEIALIVGVALVAIGPKDLPVALRTITQLIKKARRMAAEFQTHVDDLVREANLDEVRNQINEIRNFDIRGEVERAVDADGSLRNTLNTGAGSAYAMPSTDGEVATEAHADTALVTPSDSDPAHDGDAGAAAPVPAAPAAPSFIPPAFVMPPPAAVPAASLSAPAFVPPAFAINPPAS